jgi:uncharacterized repeat protein (TIGR01451 family)
VTGTGTNGQGRRVGKPVVGLIAAMAAFFVCAAPAMAAPTTFTPSSIPASPQETEGPGGYELNVTATDPDDPTVDVTCTPNPVPVGVNTPVSCTAHDSVENTNTVHNFNLTVTDTERSDLEIDKFASHLKASPGQHITYSFKVTNHGPSPATNVKVRDPLSKHLNFISNPGGGCTVTSGELVCTLPGPLGVGASHTFTVVLQLHPSHHQGEEPSEHDLDVLKFEQFVEPPPLGAEPYFKHTMTCPAGYTATDGSARTDSAQDSDQPGVSHAVERVHTVRSRSNPGNRAQWDFTLQNHNLGQAQVHLFIVCLRDSTSHNDGHAHPFIYSGPVNSTLIVGAGGGRNEITLTCPGANDVAIAPGFDFRKTTAPFAEDGPHGPQYRSTQSADGRSWTFGFQTAAAARVDVSIRCLSRYTGSAGNPAHTETLNFHHVYGRDVVAPFAGFGNSGPWTEVRRECPVHYKGITATWRFPRHVSPMGNTPEPLIRDFRVFNKSPHAKYAHTDLMCLKNRTRDDLNGGSVRNTASTYGNQPDWIFGNNIDFFDLEDPPLDPGAGGAGDGGGSGSGDGGGSGGSGGSGGGGSAADGGKETLRVGDKVTHAGRTAMVPLFGGDDPSEGELSLDAGKNHLGDADFDLDAGEDAFVDVKLSKKGKKLLKNRRFVHVTIESGGESTTQRLGVAH